MMDMDEFGFPLVDHVATPSEAVSEYAWNAGQDHPEQAWLLHDWDVWVRNPHYVGPPVRHPEDDGGLWEPEAATVPLAVLLDDEIPF